MTTPIETVADALIAFILSLLRDPAALEEFNDDPETAMAARGVQGACAADVKSVAPIIVDDPSVAARPSVNVRETADPRPFTPPGNDSEVVREISRIINQFTTIDARSTVVDMSTNQNIWTDGGDVTQIFDQEAVVASGDNSIGAGGDVTVDTSDTTVSVGDVSIGNTTNTDSNNTTTTGTPVDTSDDAAVDDAVDEEADAAASVPADLAEVDGLEEAADAVDTAIDTATAAAPAAAEPVADEAAPLMTDMTDPAGSDSSEPLTAPEPEAYPEEILEEQ
jgi:hypothetical protein